MILYIAGNSNSNYKSYTRFPFDYIDTTGKGYTTFTGNLKTFKAKRLKCGEQLPFERNIYCLENPLSKNTFFQTFLIINQSTGCTCFFLNEEKFLNFSQQVLFVEIVLFHNLPSTESKTLQTSNLFPLSILQLSPLLILYLHLISSYSSRLVLELSILLLERRRRGRRGKG